MKNLFFFILLVLVGSVAIAQVDISYQTPDPAIMELADVDLPPRVQIDSKGENLVLLTRGRFKSINELSQKELRLAGLRINPRANIYSRMTYYNGISVQKVGSKSAKSVKGLPENPRLSNFNWSPNEKYVAFTQTDDAGLSLWILDIARAEVRRLTENNLNANLWTPYLWHPNNKELLLKVLPENRDPLVNKSDAIPSGPRISVNDGKKAQNRTYQDLLKDKVDEANFERLAVSRLMMVNLKGEIRPWKDAAMYDDMGFSPNGKYVMLSKIKRPFSYLVPYYRFPAEIAVYDLSANKLQTIVNVPLIEDLPKGFMAVREGRRNIDWRADKPATLYWSEALDGGDPAREVEYRDAVYQLEAPFDGDARFLVKVVNRFRSIQWGNDKVAVASDRWFSNRNTRSYLFNPSNSKQAATTIFDRNYQDRYSNPGRFVTYKNKFGRSVLQVDGKSLYLLGDGYSDKGIFPFVDQFDMRKATSKRLWQASDEQALERLWFAIDMKKGTVLSRIEGKDQFPNYYIRNVKSSGRPQAITDFENPFASLSKVSKKLLTYKRDDGIDLSATLYLPADYDPTSGEKLPMLMWAYPVEYKDKSSAGQVTSSPNEFTFPSYGSPIFWVNRGYAVLEDTAFPILGEDDQEPNDTFVKQLVGNAKAAIDVVDEMGYIDRNRVGVGGHSYGAFMVANLLSHSDLFAGGIARSGAYNRTLTPFGFQREQRTYWEAPEIYYSMSPFMHADKMKHPLLLIHGEADNNSGTYPLQSERYFNALKGLGATVRLVMLPKESHGYRARESILHMLWEQDTWLEKHVKNRKAKEAEKENAAL